MFYKLDAKLFPKHAYAHFRRSDNGMVFSDRYMKYGTNQYSKIAIDIPT
jgi:hypothetical protein